jgi:hypothetical protein
MNVLAERPSPAIKKTGDLRPGGSETCHFHQFWRSARLSPSGNRFRALPTARERPDLGGPYPKRGAIWGIPVNTYRGLFAAKFDVLREMEADLPFKAFTRERVIIIAKKDHLLNADAWIPEILGLPFAAIFIYALTRLH